MKWIPEGTADNGKPLRYYLEGYSFYNSPYIAMAEYGYHVLGKHTPTKGFKGITAASLTRAKHYAEKQLSKYKIGNPPTAKLGKWMKAKAVRFLPRGIVQIKR